MNSIIKTVSAVYLSIFAILVLANDSPPLPASNTDLTASSTDADTVDQNAAEIQRACIDPETQNPIDCIKILVVQRGENDRHFCFKPPLTAFILKRQQAETTETLKVKDSTWWDEWEAGEYEFSLPLDTFRIQDNSQYSIQLGNIEKTLHFHQIPNNLHEAETLAFIQSKKWECPYPLTNTLDI